MAFSAGLCCLVLLIASCTASIPARKLKTSDKVLLKSDFVAQGSEKNPSNHGLNITRLPQNTAVMSGDSVILTCSVNSTSIDPRMHWIEYAYYPGGGMISDGEFILPGHPQRARYSILRDDEFMYDLMITGANLDDGGRYECYDSSSPDNRARDPQARDIDISASAQLIVIDSQQNCSSYIPTNGLIVEGFYYTVECIVDFSGNIVPYMRWEGPAPFSQAQTNTDNRVWSGMSFYAVRTMSGQYWTNGLNFTNNFNFPTDFADNIPAFRDDYHTTRVQVHWSPQNMDIIGVKPDYQVGDDLECVADAYPTADYEWHNLRTNQRFPGSIITIPPVWLNTDQIMRCQATNEIGGLPYSNDISLQVTVVDRPTPPTTTVPTTTTPPPAVSNCLNFNGRWESIRPSDGQMCLEVDPNGGTIHGVLRNATDTFWIDLVGLTDVSTNDHITFTGIWPLNRAVTSFIGECSRCHGEEIMLVSAISRQKGGPPCATPGVIQYSQEFEFRRNTGVFCPPITIPST